MPAIDLWRARSLHDDIDHVLIDEETLQRRITELGSIMSEEYSGKDLLLVSVLKGSLVFMADLIRSISIPHAIDFMATSSYGAGMDSSGIVRIMKDLNYPITGRNVVLVEDIIDSGHTLEYLVGLLGQRNPSSLRILALLDKPYRREVDVPVDLGRFLGPQRICRRIRPGL